MLLFSYATFAGEADIIAIEVEHTGGNFYRFIVTVQHDDEGWEHFAKAWKILDSDGNVLGVRVLLHPHISEQPFTRSQTISLPKNINQVTIRANTQVTLKHRIQRDFKCSNTRHLFSGIVIL